MYTVKSSAEFIADLRAIDARLKNLRLSSVEVDRKQKSILYAFICDNAVDEDLQHKILAEAEKITSPAFSAVHVSVKKIVSNDELVNNGEFIPTVVTSLFLIETSLWLFATIPFELFCSVVIVNSFNSNLVLWP